MDGRRRGDRVESGIDLDEVEHLAVELQKLRLRRVARIEGPDPEVVGVPDAADAKLHGGAHGGGGRRLLRMTPGGRADVPLLRGTWRQLGGISGTDAFEFHIPHVGAHLAEEDLLLHAMRESHRAADLRPCPAMPLRDHVDEIFRAYPFLSSLVAGEVR